MSTRSAIGVVYVATAVMLSWPTAAEQWPRYPTLDIPRTADGEPDWFAAAPRASDGRPDLSGMWRGGGGNLVGRGAPFRSPFSAPKPDVWMATGMYVGVGLPLTDYGDTLLKARQAADGRDNPRSHCRPMGFMQLHMLASPAKYLQTPRELVILYESNGERREIFTDGRSLPDDSPQPWWNGYSVGRWEGDTLVVESTHFRDGGWLDMAGTPLTDAARVTERFRRPAYGLMEIDITIDDRKAFLRPITVRWNQSLLIDQELIESVCLENNHFPRDGRVPRF
jgi:hypothetical protein